MIKRTFPEDSQLRSSRKGGLFALIINSIIILAALISGFLMLWRIPLAHKIDRREPGPKTCSVSIIIPARNEALRLPPLLKSLCQQDLKPHEVIVVDDESTDDTSQIAQDGGANVIPAEKLEGAWVGKSRACWSGASLATGDWLLFLDADTQLNEPESLGRLLLTIQNLGGGILSVQPYHMVVRFYESLSAVFNIVAMAGINAFTPLGELIPAAGLFGPCLLCKREDYFMVGGHEAIGGDIMENLALGQSFRRGGLALHCLGGRGIISFRMYPESFSQLIEGWTKSFGAAASYTHPLVFGMIIAWISGGFSVLNLLLIGISSGSAVWIASGIVAYTVYALQMAWLARQVGNFHPVLLMLFPVLLLFFTLLFIRSLYQTRVLRAVTWRGRRIKV